MKSALALLLLAGNLAAQTPATNGNGVSTSTYSGPALRLLKPEEYPTFEERFKAKAGAIKTAKRAIKYLEKLPATKTIKIADRDYGPGLLIDSAKAPAGKGLELVWLKDRFEALDLHIQGSAILKLTTGKSVLAKYAATNARPYNSVGLTLVKAGVISREEITHARLRDYLRANPDAESWILASNPRYVFLIWPRSPRTGSPSAPRTSLWCPRA